MVHTMTNENMKIRHNCKRNHEIREYRNCNSWLCFVFEAAFYRSGVSGLRSVMLPNIFKLDLISRQDQSK